MTSKSLNKKEKGKKKKTKQKRFGRGSNPKPLDCESSGLSTEPPLHLLTKRVSMYLENGFAETRCLRSAHAIALGQMWVLVHF